MPGRYQVQQRRLLHRGRRFHFVSYDGRRANPRRNEPATEPAWFLLAAGHRWEVMPQYPGEAPDEVDRRLTEWLETKVFADDD